MSGCPWLSEEKAFAEEIIQRLRSHFKCVLLCVFSREKEKKNVGHKKYVETLFFSPFQPDVVQSFVNPSQSVQHHRPLAGETRNRSAGHCSRKAKHGNHSLTFPFIKTIYSLTDTAKRLLICSR